MATGRFRSRSSTRPRPSPRRAALAYWTAGPLTANRDYTAFLVMILFYGVGDVATTLWIFHDPTLVEMNLLVRRMGPAWFVVGKTLMVALGYALVRLARSIEEADYSFVPIWYNGFQAIAGALLTTHNLGLIVAP